MNNLNRYSSGVDMAKAYILENDIIDNVEKDDIIKIGRFYNGYYDVRFKFYPGDIIEFKHCDADVKDYSVCKVVGLNDDCEYMVETLYTNFYRLYPDVSENVKKKLQAKKVGSIGSNVYNWHLLTRGKSQRLNINPHDYIKNPQGLINIWEALDYLPDPLKKDRMYNIVIDFSDWLAHESVKPIFCAGDVIMTEETDEIFEVVELKDDRYVCKYIVAKDDHTSKTTEMAFHGQINCKLLHSIEEENEE